MTSLTDPEKITLPEIERLKAEIMFINPDLWIRIHNEIVNAWIAGAKFEMEKKNEKN